MFLGVVIMHHAEAMRDGTILRILADMERNQ